MGKYHPGLKVFGNWEVKAELGGGGYGTVYEIGRNEFGVENNAAMKVITIPNDKAEIERRYAQGFSTADIKKYYFAKVESIVKEISLMAKLKGAANIVAYEDHMVIEHTDDIGWDVLIRMEKLTPLHTRMKSGFTGNDVIRLGIDICRALELCERNNVIHRDVKPENIMVSENNDYKLGDFGIARTAENSVSVLSQRGTFPYMSPEVFHGEKYGYGADIYSLGLVLYYLLNRNRGPFLPVDMPYDEADESQANMRRLNGEHLPSPMYAGEALSKVILKACAYDAKDRYASAADMRAELEEILHEPSLAFVRMETNTVLTYTVDEVANKSKTIGLFDNIPNEKVVSDPVVNEEKSGKKKEKAKVIVPIVICTLLVLGAIIVFLFKDTIFPPADSESDDDANVTTVDVVNTVESTTEETEVSEGLPTIVELPDGGEEHYRYNEDGTVRSKVVYAANGAFVMRYEYTYSDGEVVREKQKNAEGKLVKDTVLNADSTKTVTEYYFNGTKMTGGVKNVYAANGTKKEEHTLNEYGDATSVKFYNAQGNMTVTREYHFTNDGYRDGYTDTDSSGKKTRYNEDGTVYKQPEQTTVVVTTAKPTSSTPKPVSTTAAKTEAAPAPQETPASNGQTIKAVNAYTDNVYDNNGNFIAQITYYDEAHWKMKVYDDKVKRVATEYDWSSGSKVTKEERHYDYYGHVTIKKMYTNGSYSGKIEYDYYNDIGKIKEERHYNASGALIKTIQNRIMTNNDGSYFVKGGRYTYKIVTDGKEDMTPHYWYQ